MKTHEIQRRLAALGFRPGPIDGIPGRLTQKAIRAFQASRGLTADGIVGPKTLAALLTDRIVGLSETGRERVAAAERDLPWMEIAEAAKRAGIDERGDREEIAEWADDLGLRNFDARAVPWCGLCVAHCLSAALPEEALPANPLGARNFMRFGRACEPQYGAVLVFWRESRHGFKGHVGFYAGEDDDAFHVLGGNQSDAVTIAHLAKARLLGARWPSTAPFLATGRVEAGGSGGELSQNEA